MWMNQVKILLSIVLTIIRCALATQTNTVEEGDIVELAQFKGFQTEQYVFTTPDGYKLTLTRVLNPAFNNGSEGLASKRVMLFIPGETVTGTSFSLFSQGVEPKDLSEANEKSLLEDPSSNSILFLGLNRGHEAWLLNRRGTPSSLEHEKYEAYKQNRSIIGYVDSEDSEECFFGDEDVRVKLASLLEQYSLESIDPRYWNYSLDIQARFDIPFAIEKILDVTKRDKLALIGHSSGSSLILMAQVVKPELAELVSTAILLSPTMYRSNQSELQERAIKPIVSNYSGPLSNKRCTKQLKCLMEEVCRLEFGKDCDETSKKSDEQVGNDKQTMEEFQKHNGFSRSKLQFEQIIENKGNRMHFHSYKSIIKEPAYQLDHIKLKTMALWFGKDEEIIDTAGISKLVEELRVPIEVNYLNKTGFYFNHISTIIHEDVKSLVNLPAMQRIENY